jgi:hypothetical protein
VINTNDKEGLKALSQHPIRNAFYEGICLRGNKRGIHGMLPGSRLLVGTVFNVGHKITGHFSVVTFTHRNRYPLAMYNQNITLSLFLSNFFYQGKKRFGKNVTDPHVVKLVDHVRFSLLVER